MWADAANANVPHIWPSALPLQIKQYPADFVKKWPPHPATLTKVRKLVSGLLNCLPPILELIGLS